MTLVLAACALLAVSGVAGAALSARRGVGLTVAAAGTVPAAICGSWAALRVLLSGRTEAVEVAGSLPGSRLALALDPLSAWFVVPVLCVGSLAAIYGSRYLRGSEARPAASQALFYNLLLAALTLVLVAADGLVFLFAWEAMTLCAYLLVVHEHHRAEVRSAGLLYLVLTHAGTACVLAFFTVLGTLQGSLRFSVLAAHLPLPAATGAGLFALALVGFGTKAGVWPLHVWLPAAHPVAPTHVSAVLSGLVLKAGIYGLLRSLLLLGPLPRSCGVWLIVAGAASGVLGVLSALAQHELKRLLAYHSIENIGIILLGIGVGVLGISCGAPAIAALGFAGALLHATNHALFKSLLFLSAGAVKRACGTLQIDQLGGLLRRMPRTGLLFLVGAAAISGLPPLNGFASELLIYLGLFGAGAAFPLGTGAVALLGAAALALMGGLAAACFVKVFGTVFLGTPRAAGAAAAAEAPVEMLAPMAILAVACCAIGIGLPAILPLLDAPVRQLGGVSVSATPAMAAAFRVTQAALCLALGCAALAALRAALLRGRAVTAAHTWACGYARPSPSMQYTAASFASPLVQVFAPVLVPTRHLRSASIAFPVLVECDEHASDVAERYGLEPALRAGGVALKFLRRLQATRVQSYVLAVFATLLALLWWKVAR